MVREAGSAAGPTLAVDVLGPMRLTVGGVDVEVPGPKRRAVLALLTMAAPRAASSDGLIDAVWPEEPPASARAALQSHVSRLRGHLGDAASRLVANGAGYRLQLEPAELDAARVDALVKEARTVAPGDPVSAMDLLAQAQDFWRGDALEEFRDVEPLTAWGRTLADLRLTAAELLAECALAAGDAAGATQVAAEAVAGEPLREPTVLLLMRALAAAGRSADALRAGHDYRRRLAEDAGLEPTSALADLEHQVASGSIAPADARVVAFPARRVPTPASQLIGRDAELAGVSRLLESERLVTLVGPGGVGKTHLALEAARRARTAHDVVFVDLAPVTEGSTIVDVLAGALALREPTHNLVAACAALLASAPRLLVLDNCEHLLDDVRDLAGMLVGACPELTVLATSRERIGLAFEQVCRVAPLAVPEPDQTAGLATVPSVAVFVERARRVRPELEPNAEQLATIGRITRRLDGVPLAIELAAGRLSSMSLDDLAARLDRALDLLGGRVGATEGRHRTLRAAIEWSYDLLPEDEQRLFRRLAIFPDGFDLATAEDIAGDVDGPLEPATAIAHLVDASMLVASFDDVPRYRMLDTLRSFGVDRLRAELEYDAATACLLEWAADLARWIEETMRTDAEPLADARLRAELGNLRAAWGVARSTGDLDRAAHIAVALHDATSWRELTELGNWTIELARDPGIVEHRDAALVFASASEAMWMNTGNLDEAEHLARRGLERAGDHDRRGRLRCLAALGDAEHFRGRYDTARAVTIEAAATPEWESFAYGMAALGAAYTGELDAAREWSDRGVAAATSPTQLGFSRYAAGEIANASRDWAAAESHYCDALALANCAGATFLAGVASVGLVSAQGANGQIDEALTGYRDLVGYWEQTGGWTQQWTTLRNLADLLATLGDDATAAFLRKAADDAPEASTVGVTSGAPAAVATSAAPREHVLGVARQAIDRELATRRVSA